MRVEDAKQQNGLDDVTIVSQSQDRIPSSRHAPTVSTSSQLAARIPFHAAPSQLLQRVPSDGQHVNSKRTKTHAKEVKACAKQAHAKRL